MSSHTDRSPAIPDRPDEPTAPPEFKSRPRDEDRLTRKPLAWWDRVKLLALFLGGWLVLLWGNLANYDPIITFGDAVAQTLRSGTWLLVLAGLEVIRQIH